MLKSLASKYKTVSILGLTKNAGKTTFLNWLLEQAPETDLALAVTSSGRDGEEKDLVTGLPKPRIFLRKGMLVTTAEELYPLCEGKLEILRETAYFSALGRILICRVLQEGNMQVVGPVSAKDHRLLCRDLLTMGADFVLIDGAADRKSMGSPDSADAVVLAAGAALSVSMAKVAEETCHVVDLYGLPKLEESLKAEWFPEGLPEEPLLIRDGVKVPLSLRTALGAGEVLDGTLKELLGEAEDALVYCYLPGALTRAMAEAIHKKRLSKTIFIVDDPTKIFMSAVPWKQSVKRGLRVLALRDIRVAGVAVNPWSPEGKHFDPAEFLQVMQAALPGIPVIDVKHSLGTLACGGPVCEADGGGGEIYEQIKS
ncbi:MAG: hypothetical protein E7224_03460 [Clostridiales bacterium]|nr:hypothetical protein [Clostridiales bacterium]